MYRCRGSSRPATVLGYSYNCQTAVCTDTCSNQLMKFCPCNGVMRRLGSRFRTRKTCSKRATLPPNKDGGFVATENHVIVTSCRPPEYSIPMRIYGLLVFRGVLIFWPEFISLVRVICPPHNRYHISPKLLNRQSGLYGRCRKLSNVTSEVTTTQI